jgi:hypothetical protein
LVAPGKANAAVTPESRSYTLLGMAIKYAGLQGVNITVIGRNHDTF